MTKIQEVTMVKWIIGVFLTVFLALMSFQTATTQGLRDDMKEFMQQNNEDHLRIEKTLIENYQWTHSVHLYEIEPNTKRSKMNSERLTKGGL